MNQLFSEQNTDTVRSFCETNWSILFDYDLKLAVTICRLPNSISYTGQTGKIPKMQLSKQDVRKYLPPNSQGTCEFYLQTFEVG